MSTPPPNPRHPTASGRSRPMTTISTTAIGPPLEAEGTAAGGSRGLVAVGVVAALAAIALAASCLTESDLEAGGWVRSALVVVVGARGHRARVARRAHVGGGGGRRGRRRGDLRRDGVLRRSRRGPHDRRRPRAGRRAAPRAGAAGRPVREEQPAQPRRRRLRRRRGNGRGVGAGGTRAGRGGRRGSRRRHAPRRPAVGAPDVPELSGPGPPAVAAGRLRRGGDRRGRVGGGGPADPGRLARPRRRGRRGSHRPRAVGTGRRNQHPRGPPGRPAARAHRVGHRASRRSSCSSTWSSSSVSAGRPPTASARCSCSRCWPRPSPRSLYVPARERLAETANRLVYGERHPPGRGAAHLGQPAQPVDPDGRAPAAAGRVAAQGARAAARRDLDRLRRPARAGGVGPGPDGPSARARPRGAAGGHPGGCDRERLAGGVAAQPARGPQPGAAPRRAGLPLRASCSGSS